MLPDFLKTFNFEEFLFRFRYYLLIFFIGLTLIGLGFILSKKAYNLSGTKVEVLQATSGPQNAKENILVDVSGEVEKPGVYKLTFGARIEDALIAAGGISSSADRLWLEKNLNRAAKLSDGQKIYIPKTGEHFDSLSAKNSTIYQNTSGNSSNWGSGLVNINAASQKELEALPGIGPVYAQNIIEYRPYSTVEELLSKGALKKSVYEKIKELITVY